MPTSLSLPVNLNLRRLNLIAILLIFPLFFFGQTLTGLWTGAMSNDSSTVRKDQSFEIALTEYRGKVYGYSRSEFIVNDTLYYIVKRVTGTIDGDVCEVTDEKIESYNFRGKLDKGIKVTSTFRRNQTDSTWYLDGTWKTNITKKYYAVTGKIGLQEEKDLASSKLFPHLEELNIANDVAFYKEFKERKEVPVVVRIAQPEKIKTEYNDRPQPTFTNSDVAIVPAKPVIPIASTEPVNDFTVTSLHADKESVADLPNSEIKKIPESSVAITPVAVNKTVAKNKIPEVKNIPDESISSVAPNAIIEKKEYRSVATPDLKKSAPVAKTVINQDKPVAKTQNPTAKQPVAIVKSAEVKSVAVNNPVPEKKEVQQEIKPAAIKSDADITAKAAIIEGRRSEFNQIVNFKADSLELSLYDNGEIDGDTVSVFLNGEVIWTRQGLKASAIKKTIYITPGNEDFTLVLFADNLGKYPPNTGLLVVHDGDDVYNLRFSSDFQKSSGIVFRRKK